MNWDFLHYACFIFGLGFFADGVGSILIRKSQYHSVWFDGERLVRAAAGIALTIIALLS